MSDETATVSPPETEPTPPPAKRRTRAVVQTTPEPEPEATPPAETAMPAQNDSYIRAKTLIDGGLTGKAAFARVAEETGKSPGTIQTAYYRIARTLPDGGGVQQRPRKQRARPSRNTSTRNTGVSLAQITRDLHRALDALTSYAKALETTNANLAADAQRYHDILAIAKKGSR